MEAYKNKRKGLGMESCKLISVSSLSRDTLDLVSDPLGNHFLTRYSESMSEAFRRVIKDLDLSGKSNRQRVAMPVYWAGSAFAMVAGLMLQRNLVDMSEILFALHITPVFTAFLFCMLGVCEMVIHFSSLYEMAFIFDGFMASSLSLLVLFFC